MKSVAIYSLKGGVGKTTLAVNLAWASATLSSRRTLLWDLDPQRGATYLLGGEGGPSDRARAVFAKSVAPGKLVRPTDFERLSLLPADISLRELDRYLFDLGKKKRLEKLLEMLGRMFERVILDCPPGLTETSEQVLRAADVIVVPVIPSPLSQRALEDVVDYLDRKKLGRGAILPVHSMVDRRRTLHVAALDAHRKWPVVPMASAFEAMSDSRMPVGAATRRGPAAASVAALWTAIEKRLAGRG
ncbi:MAG TPA: ParA family protein [Allosphingosinicella sp.]|nr:ParA family protein [Allosphingosinicella sp.]